MLMRVGASLKLVTFHFTLLQPVISDVAV